MNDKMRKEFDEAFRKRFGFGRMTASANADADQMLKAAEWAWQASRECLVIELPDSPGRYYNGAPSAATEDPLECWRDGYKSATNRIHAAGLKTK